MMYVAQIGDYVKVGYSWRPDIRLINLRSEYRCDVTLLGAIAANEVDEVRFHRAHKAYAVASEIYPPDAPPIVELLARIKPYLIAVREKPHGCQKWKEPLPAGVIPFNYQGRHRPKRKASAEVDATTGEIGAAA